MPDAFDLAPGSASNESPRERPAAIVIQNHPAPQPWFGRAVLKLLLFISILANFSLLGLYLQYYPNVVANEQFKEGEPFATDKIAVIRVTGMITSASIDHPRKELKTAAEDEGVKAVVLAIDSPGGTITGSDELYHALVEFKSKTSKPVVVSMQGMATSGGYYVAMPADRIFADRSCVTGSIGVIASLMNFEKLLKDWGVTPEVIKSGKMKDSGSPFRSMTDEERAEWQKMINTMYDQFIGVIVKHRGTKIGGEKKLRELADGRVYLASEAKTLGLIDEIGYEHDAIDAAKALAGLGDKVRIITYSRPFGGWLGLLGVRAEQPAGAQEVAKLLELASPRLLYLPSTHLPLTLP